MRANTYIAPSGIHQLGLFAKKQIKKGDRIIQGKSDYWQQHETYKNQFIHITRPHLWCMINHAKNPNTFRKGTKHEMILAKIDIKKYEEVTENYYALPKNLRPFIPVNLKQKALSENQVKKLVLNTSKLSRLQCQQIVQVANKKPKLIGMMIEGALAKNEPDLMMHLFAYCGKLKPNIKTNKQMAELKKTTKVVLLKKL